MSFAALDQVLVDHLDGLTVAGFTRPCGYVDVPDGTGWQGEPGSSPFADYLTVWPTDAERDPLMLADPHRHLEVPWVIKAVSISPWQAKQLGDAAHTALIAPDLTPPAGLAINWTRVSGLRGPYPDHDTVPELHVVAMSFMARIQTVPT